MRIFAEVPWGGASNDSAVIVSGLSTTAIFSVFAGYFFGNFRDETSDIIQRYAVCRQLFSDPKMYDFE